MWKTVAFSRTAPFLAENKVMTDDNMADLQAVNQDIPNKILGWLPGHLVIEREDIQEIDAERFEVSRLGSKRRETKGFQIGH